MEVLYASVRGVMVSPGVVATAHATKGNNRIVQHSTASNHHSIKLHVTLGFDLLLCNTECIFNIFFIWRI